MCIIIKSPTPRSCGCALAGVLHEHRAPSASLKRPWRARSRCLEAGGSRPRPRSFTRKRQGDQVREVSAKARSRWASVRRLEAANRQRVSSAFACSTSAVPTAVSAVSRARVPCAAHLPPGFSGARLRRVSLASPRSRNGKRANTYLKRPFLVERNRLNARFISADKQTSCCQSDALSKTKVSRCQYL